MTGLSTMTLYRATRDAFGKAMAQYYIQDIFASCELISMDENSYNHHARYKRQYQAFEKAYMERLTELEEKAARFDLPDSLSVEDKETKHVWIHKHLKGIHGGTKPPDDWKAD